MAVQQRKVFSQHRSNQIKQKDWSYGLYIQTKKRKRNHLWRAVIRIKGYPTICDHFDRKQEAEDWAKETERRIKLGAYNFGAHNQHRTYADLIDRMYADGALSLHCSLKNCRSQFDYWKQRLGIYALIHITLELIIQERKVLIDSLLLGGKRRSPSTINRYAAVLSSTLGYAAKKLRWIAENPCSMLFERTALSKKPESLIEYEIDRLRKEDQLSPDLVFRDPFLCSAGTYVVWGAATKNIESISCFSQSRVSHSIEESKRSNSSEAKEKPDADV